jgi:hypothetical protein
MRLVEIFKEYTPKVNGKALKGRYEAIYRIERKTNPKTVTEDDLVKYVNSLQQRYPNHNFYLRRWRNYHIITRKGKYVKGRVSIYIDLEKQAFYIPKSSLEKNPKLANYIIMVTLGALGVSQSKHEAILSKAS